MKGSDPFGEAGLVWALHMTSRHLELRLMLLYFGLL